MDDKFVDEYAKVLNPTAIVIYIWLCRYSNKEQVSWPSLKKLAENLGVNEKTVRRNLESLEMHNLIQIVRIGKKCTNRYHLLDKSEWTPVSNQCMGTSVQSDGSEMSNHSDTNVQSIVSKHNSKETHIQEQSTVLVAAHSAATVSSPHLTTTKKINPLRDSVVKLGEVEEVNRPPAFVPNDYGSLIASTQRRIHIIGLYLSFKQIPIENVDQYNLLIKRNLRIAASLVGYTDEKISEAFNFLDNLKIKNNYIQWTLETAVPYITGEK